MVVSGYKLGVVAPKLSLVILIWPGLWQKNLKFSRDGNNFLNVPLLENRWRIWQAAMAARLF